MLDISYRYCDDPLTLLFGNSSSQNSDAPVVHFLKIISNKLMREFFNNPMKRCTLSFNKLLNKLMGTFFNKLI